MAYSFKSSLEAAATPATTSEENIEITTAALLSDETWTACTTFAYPWYDNYYFDEDYSTANGKNIVISKNQTNLTQEENSQVIPFLMDRYYDGVDLTTMFINIHFVNPDGDEAESIPINVEYSDSKIRFYWLISGIETAVAGKLKFEITARGKNQKGLPYFWRTKPNEELEILKSLSGNGVIEPGEGWDTYIQVISEKVLAAQEAANQAGIAANNAQAALSGVNEKIDNVSDEITNNVKADIAETLALYYTKAEIDQLFANQDFSSVLEEVQHKIDAIDGLANLVVEYDIVTNTMTFKNGDTVMYSHVLNTNPSADWVASFRTIVNEDIDTAIKPVSDDLADYKSTNDAKVNKNTEDIASVTSDLSENYYNKTEVDEKLTGKVEASEMATLKTSVEKIDAKAETNKSNISTVATKVSELETRMDNINTDPSLVYDVDYNAETGVFQFIEIEDEVETVKKNFVITGGGGGGSSTSTTVKIDRITSSPLTATKNDKVIIKYNFSSVDSSGDPTDEGTATWKVGSTIVATSIALQGENSFDVTDYVSVGTQKVTLSITDSAGTIAVKTWTVQIVDVRIESTFNDQYTYPLAEVSFDYTPYGSISKVVHFILDGSEIGTVTTSASGVPLSYTIPQQTHGSHLLEVYITAEINGSTIETNHIYKDIIWYDETSDTPVIGCSYFNISLKQYDSINIPYVVYDPKTETPTVTLSVDDEVVSTLTLSGISQIWQYKSTEIGSHTLKITCRETTKIIVVDVEKIDIDVEPITANLVFDFNPVGYSNSSDDRVWTDGKTSMTVSDNFDWVNGGYQLDENGDQYFCIKAGTTVSFDHTLFADDARKNGKEFKLIFKTANVRRSNATFLTCQSGTTPIGLQMNVHEAYVKSSLNSLYIPYSEEDIIEFEFNINKDTDIMTVMSYEDGTPYRPMSYTSDHSFTQTNPVPITIGSPDCDVYVYRMKAYSSSLSSRAILSNFIADARNATEMIDRYSRNQIYDENNNLTPESVSKARPDLKVIKLECPHFTNDKKDIVINTSVEFIHTGGDYALDNFRAVNCAHSGQGTTSNEYGEAGRNLEILMCFDGNYRNSKITYDENYKTVITMGDGTVYEDGTGKITLTRNSIPTNYLNLKVNIASSENENNAVLQKRYDEFLPYLYPAKKRDSRVKNTMEFIDCVVFIKENDPDLSTHREFQDTEWHLYAIGNIGDSKKTDYSRVNDTNDPKEHVVEIMDNTLPNSTFPGTEEALAALDADKFDEKGTYGFRYEMDGITDEQHQANMQTWRNFYRFIVNSTDEEFVAKLKDYFIVDSALYFYLFTERYTMIDNRAKNTFWHYAKFYISNEEAAVLGDDAKNYTIDDEAAAINGGYRYEFWDYDNDTGLGINNSGELTMTYGKEDTDYRTDGDPSSGYIFNAATSTFFCRIRDLMYDQLAAMYIQLESKNCWSAQSLIDEFDRRQNHFCEELWRLDYERKYERTYRNGNTRFLEQMMNGRKKYQRRQFERDQEKYIATKYFGTTATSDQIMFRCNTPVDAVVTPNYTLHLVPYSDMYLAVMFGATYRTKVRAKAGQQYDIECPFDTMDDTAVLIYCASRIQAINDISACYIHDNDFSKAIKLQELVIGNSTEGYANNFLTHLVVGNNPLLERLNIVNTPNLKETVNLSGCTNLEEFYADNSGITGVVFANGGKLRVANLPAISSLTAKNLSYLEALNISSFDNIHTLIIENTPVDTYAYVNSSTNLANVRLIGIDWGTDEGITDTSILDRLIKLAGIDNSGYNTAVSVLAGLFYSPVVKQKLLNLYNEAWADLMISYDTLIEQFTVTFVNDDDDKTVLDIQYVDKGGNAVDPVTRLINPIATPLKESSVSTDYTYSGWDLSLNGIFADRVITAQYTESVRNYTVKYIAKGEIRQTTIAPYGSSVMYEGDIPVYTGGESGYNFNIFTGWDKFGYVDGDKTINAIYDSFTYTDGCFDQMDISEMTPVQIYAMTKVKKEQELVELKDFITFKMGNNFSYEDIEETLIISDTRVFGGSNYYDTEIKLLEEDSDWTLAVDYEWGNNNANNAVLMQCYQGDGSNGFKLWNSTQPRITWGTSSDTCAGSGNRDIIVLRHCKGETNLHVYKGNLPSEEVIYTSLSASRSTAPSHLVFGCARADDGVYENYANGIIYWCKLWKTDLGDSACKALAAWTHETINLEMIGFRRYYLSDGSGSKCSMSFLASHLLENTMPLSTTTSNSGGWAAMPLNKLLNTRFFNAIPVEWRQIIKQVKISSSVGGGSTELSTSDCYITLPAIIEVDGSFNFEPYNYEGEAIPFITSASTRLRKFSDGTAGGYFTRSPNASYTYPFHTVNENGEIESYAYAMYEKGIVIELSI